METFQLPVRDLEIPPAGQVDVWFCSLDQLPLQGLTGLAEVASRTESARFERMNQQFLIRLMLGAYLGCPGRDIRIQRGPSGKPALVDPGSGSEPGDLKFNLSHAPGWLALAVATGTDVGIDIEREDRALRWRELSKRYFTPAEAEWLGGMDEPYGRRQFLVHWTAREALIKSVGKSIAGHIAAIELTPEPRPKVMTLPSDWPEAGTMTLRQIDDHPDLVAHLATTGEVGGVVVREVVKGG